MDNFKNTAYRMYTDVEILHSNKSWFNCCYLAGYVVECYCKLLLDNAIASGVNTQKTSVRDYSHKVKTMNIDLNNISISSHLLSKYCIDLNTACCNIIMNWNPNNRYNDDSYLWNQEAKASEFKKELGIVIQQIKNMELDGVI